MDRRSILKTAATGAALAVTPTVATGAAQALDTAAATRGTKDRKPPHITWTVFTRHLQWLTTQQAALSNPYDTGVLIGEKAAELGYRAVNLTVRRTGHVDPDLVDPRVNLPAVLRGVRSTGVECTFITTDIVDDVTPVATRDGSPVFARDILRVAADEGITVYRWGGFAYDVETDPGTGDPQPFGPQVLAQLDAFRDRVKGLAKLNGRLGVTAAYHTHSTNGTNARSVWDLMYVLRDSDPDELGINLDIGHMTNEGTLSSWRTNVRYAMSHIRSVGLKDTMVERTVTGTVRNVWRPAGTGMVQWRDFFALLLQGGHNGPAESHYEYDVVGLNGVSASLNTTFWADHAQFASGNLTPAFMTDELKKDLVTYRAQAAAAGWTSQQQT
jgi:sugar phosphate isomerase/epimerase